MKNITYRSPRNRCQKPLSLAGTIRTAGVALNFLLAGVAFAAASEPKSTNPLGVSAESGKTSKPKPLGRLGRTYRIMWDQNAGANSFYHPPIDPQKYVQAHFGFFERTPVDAYVCALGFAAGYTLDYPTKVKGMEFIVDRYKRGAKMGNVQFWSYAESLKYLWDRGIDPLELQVREARRLGIDFWVRLSMNDWHHADEQGNVVRLIGSEFYANHPEYRIGAEGSKGWPAKLAASAAPLHDYAHAEVRQLRLDTMAEACERYDVDGFVYDFMRCPVYFKRGEEQKYMPVMTEFIRESRAILDRIGEKKGKKIGLAVRVPNTIAGTRNLGFDIASWVKAELVDIVIPSTFFSVDLDENMSEWVELTRNSPVRIYPAVESAYQAGHTGGARTLSYKPPVMLPLTHDMIHAVAARHWYYGVDGLYTFNWEGVAATYDYDNRTALDEIGDPQRLKYKTKRYVMARTVESFPNCLPYPRQIPAVVGPEPLKLHLVVADDLEAAGSRVSARRLLMHLDNLTGLDRLEVRLNGQVLACVDPIQPGQYHGAQLATWQTYEIPEDAVRQGANEIALRMLKQNERIAAELPVKVIDLELLIAYDYPNGAWSTRPSFKP